MSDAEPTYSGEGVKNDVLESPELIASRVLADMQDGVMTIDLRGKIITFNPSAERILGLSTAEVTARSFGEVFFELESNDAFNQAILDAIYDASTTHNKIVSFHNAGKTSTLSLTTSFLQSSEAEPRRMGVITVFSDISEVRKLQETEARMAEELVAKHRELQEAFRVTEASNVKLAEAVKKVQVTRKIAGGFTVLLFLLVGLYFATKGHVGDGMALGSAEPAVEMGTEWHTVGVQPLTSSIALTGRLQPLQLVNVNSPLSGKVDRVNFQYGDRVKAGQLLLVMDTAETQVRLREAKATYIKAADNLRQLTDWDSGMDVARAKRSLTKARLSLEAQNKNLVETERLFKLGIIPANELDSVRQQTVGQQLDTQSAEEEVKAAVARGNPESLQVARFEAENAQVRLRQVELEMAHAQVIAPVSGIVVKPASGGAGRGGKGSKTAERGEVFQSGEVMLAIGDLTSFSVVSKVDEVDVTKLLPGQKVYVTGDAFQGARLSGAIRSISPQADDSGTRATPSFMVNMAIDPLTAEQSQRLLVGMSANVDIVLREKPDALMVPVSAVVSDAGKRYVMRQAVAGGKTQSAKTEVQTGATTLDAVEIVSGLKAGDVIERHGLPVNPGQ